MAFAFSDDLMCPPHLVAEVAEARLEKEPRVAAQDIEYVELYVFR